ncbi:hypothetical protein CRUP_016552, partial [Coryphaenoides rupestris]
MAERKGKPASAIKTLTKREQEEMKKKEQEKAAEVFEEFLASFESSTKSGVKTFVRGGMIYKKKVEGKKRSNLELFKEELKLIQEEREERHKRKKNDPGGGGGAYADLDTTLSRRSSFYDDAVLPHHYEPLHQLHQPKGKRVMGFEMKLGWGKPARIPPQPLYTPTGMRTAPPPPSGLPFNAPAPRPPPQRLHQTPGAL